MNAARQIVAACALVLLAGCASMEQRPPPLTRDDVVQLSASGMPAKEIIERLKATDTVLLLSGSELAKLSAAGVAPEVLDYLQNVLISEIRRRDAFTHMYPGYGAFGPCPPGWGPRFGHPAFRLRSPFWPYC